MRTNPASDSKLDHITIVPSEGKDMIVSSYLAGTFTRTFIFTGSPGIGKTSLAKEAHKELQQVLNDPNFGYIEINPTMPADEVGGIPELIRKEGEATKTDYALPAWFPRDPNWRGIICLDDALQGDRLMQQVLANFILARNLRGHKLPEGAMVIATGNRMEDKAGVTKTLTHLADRMCWLHVVADADSWIENFAVPRKLNDLVVAYIMFSKEKLDMFDPNAPKCPTPRTWEAVSGWLHYLQSLKGTPLEAKTNKFAQAILGGELGVGEAARFWAYVERADKMPKLEDLLANPSTADTKFPMDVQYAIAVGLSNIIEDSNFANALEYVDRLGPDLTTVVIRMATKRNPDLLKSKAFVPWLQKNQSIIPFLRG